MLQLTTLFASTESVAETTQEATDAVHTAVEEQSLFGALGIDWRMLLLQIIAFVVLLWILNKFVYPHLLKAIDDREKAISESVAAAENAEKEAEKTQDKIDALFKEARTESALILDSAQKEASSLIKDAEDRAKKRSEQIVSDAKSQIDRDIEKARQQLRDETVELVALATEKIVRKKVDAEHDASLISGAIKEAREA